ncbi:MAG: S1 RNA-binding domain-containing protein [Clostridiales bacterium]|nr:S1 RNA-binding domain-containing protein [Clostridiales bacterium]
MIELGKTQKLQVIRLTPIGAFLNSTEDADSDDILLPKNQLPQDVEPGDEIEVFVYKDSEDRIISTLKKPKLELGRLAMLKAVEITEVGAFLDWGLEKDLFLPFREQNGVVKKDGEYLVGLYVDKSDRLCATMNIYNMLGTESPFRQNDMVRGTVYGISKSLGAFVAVDDKYEGLIPVKELYGDFKEGDSVTVRVQRIRQDGKLELSMRKPAYDEIEGDAQKVMGKMEANGGKLMLNDKSAPEDIKASLNISKAAFKRAVGRLLKEGAIKITDDGIEKAWK